MLKVRTVRGLNTNLLCEVPGCILSFVNLKDLEDHIEAGNHRFTLEISIMYSVKTCYANLVQTLSHSKFVSAGKTPRISSNDPQVRNSTLTPHFNKNGWAIPKRQNAHFTFEQGSFLYEEFLIGGETRQKTTADKVVERMITKCTIDGKKLVTPKDYVTHEQITAAYSQMAKKYWTGKLTKPTQKNKQVEITFHENGEECSPDNVETIIWLRTTSNYRPTWKHRWLYLCWIRR